MHFYKRRFVDRESSLDPDFQQCSDLSRDISRDISGALFKLKSN
jgi:hypothetical protein